MVMGGNVKITYTSRTLTVAAKYFEALGETFIPLLFPWVYWWRFSGIFHPVSCQQKSKVSSV